MASSATDPCRLTDVDLHLFNEGTHHRLYEKLGAHLLGSDGLAGTRFAVWAPNAHRVSVIGDFNGWDPAVHPLEQHGQSGLWEGFVPAVGEGALYKYHIESRHHGYRVAKADPLGFMHETRPRTASIVRGLDYDWTDGSWMADRGERHRRDRPISIYEVHLASWRRDPQTNRSLTYREIAAPLVEHVRNHGFTHVELMPVMEHPYDGSWGYQVTGYYAPTSRFGTPQDLMFLIDTLHRHGIGVILDWVPSHFAVDEHGLCYFDGTHLYEHADPRQGFHPDWGSFVFNYGRHEVRSFLISNAVFWLDRYHADGLRVDAVASMIYLDFSRRDGEWQPNREGGRENLEAVEFLRQLNTAVYRSHPDVMMVAEESTAWPLVSRPVDVGGLGFGYKWDMGWMHDSLEYFRREPVHRRFHHGEITFRAVYRSAENYVLPLSHDEVVHGKGSLLGRMPGDDWQRFANLRLLLAHQWTQPGKKLLFMGGEFGQWSEWAFERSLDWDLLQHEPHRGLLRLVGDLNRIYRSCPALHEGDCEESGFAWIDDGDADRSLFGFLRRGRDPEETALVLLNATPEVRRGCRFGVPFGGRWREILNTDAREYGGSGIGNLGVVAAVPVRSHGHPYSCLLTLPPLAAVVLERQGPRAKEAARS